MSRITIQLKKLCGNLKRTLMNKINRCEQFKSFYRKINFFEIKKFTWIKIE